MVSYSILLLSLVPVIALSLVDIAFAQEPERYISQRVEIWGLFYRLMVIAFVIGAVVMGVIGYIVWRFRESNKKNVPREPVEGTHH